ncbi:structural maintenance of chromosomes protein 5 [Tribolium castaneum]|uniref:Structural maintenance of chromosomes protein 5 n=1 Tax=Tribolium castaneum TaxID=7070 RepID=D6WRS7_TRICA|nr:PREDICTED: structural maintenance of chromosomes protein 5 [Tribolium castaneum]EFA05955.1 Structural maintenance of chromosomes protein 5-like Protein [Tribolium castaneum]|eukprot:XP_975667.1 PREDICTED: structural maintenance of chromosomes protein 5 [Tribolium castaneum]
MFKVGSIRKIEVKNFVTYSYAELYPGPNLNMLIGPNGTGKSTIVAAIILGLGGNPKTVGRGVRVSEYVKHNCEEATIHIYLQGRKDNDFIKITRIFNTHDKTGWLVNNQRVTLKEVMDCIKQYNIQVDNLCQFLPQDRVQDFAKMNQQQLLKETQVALCRTDLIEKQEALIACKNNHKQLTEAIDKNGAKLQETRDANMRLEGKIENFSRKKKFLSQIEGIDRKIAWLQYDDLYEKMTETKADLAKATKIYEKHKSATKPAEKEIQKAKQVVQELQQSNSNITRTIREHEASARNYVEKIEQTKDKIRDIEQKMNDQIAIIEQKNQENEAMASKIEELKVAQRELLNQCGNDEEVQQKVRKLTTEMQKFRRHVSELQNQRDEIVASRQTKSAQLRAYENEINRIDNVKQQRLNYLQRVDRDAYEAVVWLRNNRNLFKGEIYEPIMLELNVLDSKNAMYVENVIPLRDRVAFTCTNKDDMNALIRLLRNEKQLTVNVLYAGDPNDHVSRYQPSIPIEQLRKYGLYAYMHSLFTAPEPIMRYLCKTYRVHDIPIGNKQTNEFFQAVPSQIRVFFSDKVKYSVSYSRYTKAKSIRQNEIRSNGGFSISVDVLQLERLRGQMQELRNSFDTCDTQMKELDTQISLINEKVSKLGEEHKYIHSIKQQVQTIETRIVAMQRKVQELQQQSSNGDEIRAQGRNKIRKVIRVLPQLSQELKNTYESLTVLTVKSELNFIKIEKARRHAAYLENKAVEARRLMEESEATLNQVKEAYANVKGQAKAALQKAKGLSKGYTPGDEAFEEFRETHERLSSDLRELQEEKLQLNAKIECLSTADDDEMREYEERVETIKNLQGSIERAHVDLSKISAKMDQLREEWLGPLGQLVTEINANFATAFERMGCAGEVSINPGDDEQDFSNYGLRIKVTYRNGQPMQELNSVVQSGGERAVATAVFMLALQELTPVPFRCVDEINQGMDVNNERRIFDLLVESTSQADTAQYFLITPKLVPNLSYSRSTMVHIVHNGPFVEPDRKWGMSKLCNPQRALIH